MENQKLNIKNKNFNILLRLARTCSFVILIFTFYILHLSVLPVKAADSTPSASIKTYIEQFKKEVASKAAKLKKEIDTKLKNKAYVGKVKLGSENSLTIATNSGPKIVGVNQDTVFEGKGKFSFKTIVSEDYLAALGDVDEIGVMTAKKIVKMPDTSYQPKTYLWGQIISLSDKLATIKDRDLKSVAVSMPENDLKVNDFVILTGSKNKNDIFEAEFVHVLQKGFIKPKKVATPSASIKPSSSPAAKPNLSTKKSN